MKTRRPLTLGKETLRSLDPSVPVFAARDAGTVTGLSCPALCSDTCSNPCATGA